MIKFKTILVRHKEIPSALDRTETFRGLRYFWFGNPMNEPSKSQDDTKKSAAPFGLSMRFGLREKIVLILVVVLFVVSVITIWTLKTVGGRVADDLGASVAERYVLWHKERVLGSVQRLNEGKGEVVTDVTGTAVRGGVVGFLNSHASIS